ncbi:MAG: sugar phosphate nucleotidyltransferase [Verrucomicrobiota bacterium]|nr:sugar phosphate nucleotidyltransferase [Verrucomicrobiota bacterium]
MKAVILAAGKGTRMGELTDETPKPMLLVEGRPILEHIITGLRETGIREFCVVTGWKAEVIEGYFGNGTDWQVTVTYVRQEVQDGTGKAPELAKEFVGDASFLLTYGDILVKPETYQQMIGRWAEGGFLGLVTVTGSEDVTKGGLFFFDQQFHLQHLVEKPSAEQLDELRVSGWIKEGDPVWYNAGIYCFTPQLFSYTAQLQKSSRGEYELTDALCAMLADGGTIAGLSIAGRWVDVRDPDVLQALQESAE